MTAQLLAAVLLILGSYQPNPGANSVNGTAIQSHVVTTEKLAPGIQTAWYIYRLEDYGGVLGCSTSMCRTANNTAWESMMTAMGSALDYTSTYHVQFGVGSYYFANEIHCEHKLLLSGAGSGPNGGTGGTGTALYFPPAANGIFVDYVDPFGTGYNGSGSKLEDLEVRHDQNLAFWTATHAYSLGDSVQPTTAHGWGGYVFVVTTAGTSGGSQPAWPEDLQVPSGTSGQTVSDGSVTWTAHRNSLINIRAQALADNVFAVGSYGDGWSVFGDTTNSLADSGFFSRCGANNNRSAGVYAHGADSNVNYFSGFQSLLNGTWGIYDKSFLGNTWHGVDFSYNGPQVWGASSAGFTVGTEAGPTVPNGYSYLSGGGTTSSTEPTWPTTIGATVTDGSVTWTCYRKLSGGPLYLGEYGNIYGVYVESGSWNYHNDGIIIGEFIGNDYDSTSVGVVWRSQNSLTPQTYTQHSGNGSYDAITRVGDWQKQLEWLRFGLNNKDGSFYDELVALYQSSGYVGFTNDEGAHYPLLLPLVHNSDGGVAAPAVFQDGIRLGLPGGFGTPTMKQINASSAPANVSNVFGDVAWLVSRYAAGGDNIDGTATADVCVKSGDGSSVNGIWRESAWTAPAEGHRIDQLSEVGETDLHFLFDDIVTKPYTAMETLNSREGSYAITWTAPGLGPYAIAYGERAPSSLGGVFYDSALRTRKILFPYTASSYGTIASNSAHTLPTSGQRSLEVSFTSANFGGGPYGGKVTLIGYADVAGHNGYDLSINTDGSIEFEALNTAGGKFIDLHSSASLATGTLNGSFHLAAVNFDSTNNLYELYLDGVVVASATSVTGTLGNTAANVGVAGLLINGAISNNALSTAWIAEIGRQTRLLTSAEIVARAAQYRAALGLSTQPVPLPGFVVSVASSYTMGALDRSVSVSATGSAWTITLPSIVGVADGVRRTLTDTSGGAATHNITWAAHSGETINGASTAVISSNNGSLTIESQAGVWVIVGKV